MTGPQIATSLRTILLRTEEQGDLYRRKCQEVEALTVHVRAVIAFIENKGLDADRPSSARTSVAGIFARGEIYAQCLKALGDSASDLSTRQLAESCMISKGLDSSEYSQRKSMMQYVIEVLTVNKHKGDIVSMCKVGTMRMWRLRRGA